MNSRELNFLPPLKKMRLKQLVNFMFVKELLELVTFASAILGIAYLAGWLLITNFFTGLAASTTAINRGYSHYNLEIVQINSIIHKLKLASAEFFPLTQKVLDLTTTLPADVRLMDINLDRATQTLTISGVAKTREALLEYQTTLGKIPWLSDVRMPASQLFQKENIGFQIKATITGAPPLGKVAGTPVKSAPANE